MLRMTRAQSLRVSAYAASQLLRRQQVLLLQRFRDLALAEPGREHHVDLRVALGQLALLNLPELVPDHVEQHRVSFGRGRGVQLLVLECRLSDQPLQTPLRSVTLSPQRLDQQPPLLFETEVACL
jgi:hypothetical protein